jgi:Tol biopolymer transport system component
LQSYWSATNSGEPIATWSPDSQQIATSIWGDGNIYLIDIKDHTLKPFVHTGGQIYSLDWSSDGTSLYFRFQAHNLDTGETLPAAPPRGLYQASLSDGTMSPVWIGILEGVNFAPDRQHFIAYRVYRGQTGIT